MTRAYEEIVDFIAAGTTPETVNKMLSALRGVLKQTWRLGLIDAIRGSVAEYRGLGLYKASRGRREYRRRQTR